MPSHRPVVGSALNWQGQPQLQLQLTTCSPAIRHVILVASLIFLLLYHVPPNRGMPHSGWVTEAIRTAICSAYCKIIPGTLSNRPNTTVASDFHGLRIVVLLLCAVKESRWLALTRFPDVRLMSMLASFFGFFYGFGMVEVAPLLVF